MPVSWSMIPAAMNSEALKVAWFIDVEDGGHQRERACPGRSAAVISPRWLMVE